MKWLKGPVLYAMNNKAAEQMPAIEDILAASKRISGQVRITPVLSDPQFNEFLGCELWLKCENLQRTGSLFRWEIS